MDSVAEVKKGGLVLGEAWGRRSACWLAFGSVDLLSDPILQGPDGFSSLHYLLP